jgi:hypothetical protein
MLLFGICRLTIINPAFGIVIEDTDIQKSCILTTAKHILKEIGYSVHPEDRGGCGVVNNKRQYARILIRKKQ